MWWRSKGQTSTTNERERLSGILDSRTNGFNGDGRHHKNNHAHLSCTDFILPMASTHIIKDLSNILSEACIAHEPFVVEGVAMIPAVESDFPFAYVLIDRLDCFEYPANPSDKTQSPQTAFSSHGTSFDRFLMMTPNMSVVDDGLTNTFVNQVWSHHGMRFELKPVKRLEIEYLRRRGWNNVLIPHFVWSEMNTVHDKITFVRNQRSLLLQELRA